MKFLLLAIPAIVLTAMHIPNYKTTSTKQETNNTLTDAEKKDGWKLLFDGKSTDGWHTYGKKNVRRSVESE